MSEWKNLEIDNLPPDILTGNYEFEKEYDTAHDLWKKTSAKVIHIINDLYAYETRYRYRKPEPKAPSHEEIMTKWWKFQDYIGSLAKWEKVAKYCDKVYYIAYNDRPLMKCDFTGKESAEIPPE